MAGDYAFYHRQYTKKTFSVALDGSAVAATQAIACKSANHRLYIQRATLSITTHANGKVVTLQDSNSSPKIIAHRADLTAAAGVPDLVEWDFGPVGVPLTLGKDLNYVANTGGSGLVGVLTVEGYEKLDTTVDYNSGASLQ